jgi:hypothetical protein
MAGPLGAKGAMLPGVRKIGGIDAHRGQLKYAASSSSGSEEERSDHYDAESGCESDLSDAASEPASPTRRLEQRPLDTLDLLSFVASGGNGH